MKILLDSYQVKAINIKDKNTLVVAAPGSGKTTVIINRVNYLIEERKVKIGKDREHNCYYFYTCCCRKYENKV